MESHPEYSQAYLKAVILYFPYLTVYFITNAQKNGIFMLLFLSLSNLDKYLNKLL